MEFTYKSRIVFLLGAGVSIPAQMPSTGSITETVLSGEGICRDSDGEYRFIDKDQAAAYSRNSEYHIRHNLNYLYVLFGEIKDYIKGRFPNYEDLFYMASQIRDNLSGNYDNPAVRPLIDKIFNKPEIKNRIMETIGRGVWNPRDFEGELLNYTEEVTNYIHDIALNSLNKEPCRLDHLNSIMAACRNDRISYVDIFTLNHDLVLESCLHNEDVGFTDGFSKPKGEPGSQLRYWNPNEYSMESIKVRVFKLHGSVNWRRIGIPNGDWRYDRIVIPWKADIARIKDSEGRELLPSRHLILLGTFNKMLEYTSGVYTHMYCQLHTSLNKSDSVVISGYSFGDKGINARIIDWLCDPRTKGPQIVVIDVKSEKEIKQAARRAIAMKWDGLKEKRILHFLRKPIEETHWQEIDERLGR